MSTSGASTPSPTGSRRSAPTGSGCCCRPCAAAAPDRKAIREALESKVGGFPSYSGRYTITPSDHQGLAESDIVIAESTGSGWKIASADPLTQFVVSGLATGALYALVAVGFVVIHNVTGILNFAQGEFAMTGAVVAVTLVGLGVPLPLAAAGGVAAAALVGLAVWYLGLRGAAHAPLVVQVIITIGVSIALRGIALLAFGPAAKPLPAFSPGGAIALGRGDRDAAAALDRGDRRRADGRAVAAVRAHAPGRGAAGGVAQPRGGPADGRRPAARGRGRVRARRGAGRRRGRGDRADHAGVVRHGLELGLKGFVAAVLGGIVSVPGAVVGGLLLGVLESVGAGVLSSGWRDAIAFAILIAVLLVRPQGLLGRSVARV